MLEGRPEIGRFHASDIGQHIVEIIEAHLYGCDWRRAGRIEGGRDTLDHGERAVGFEDVEGGEPVFPIVEGPQKRKGWRRSDTRHPVAFADDMAAAALRERQFLTSDLVPRQSVALNHRDPSLSLGIDRGPVDRECFDGPHPDVGFQPIRKPFGRWVIRKTVRDRTVSEQRPPFRPEPRGGIDVDDFDPDASFQAEARQDIFEKAVFDQLGRGAERDGFVLRSSARGKDDQQSREYAGPAKKHGSTLEQRQATRQSKYQGVE